MNIVGTPNRLVALPCSTASSTDCGLKTGPAMIVVAPWVMAPRFPITMPKQWKKGTGMTTLSWSVYCRVSPTK